MPAQRTWRVRWTGREGLGFTDGEILPGAPSGQRKEDTGDRFWNKADAEADSGYIIEDRRSRGGSTTGSRQPRSANGCEPDHVRPR